MAQPWDNRVEAEFDGQGRLVLVDAAAWAAQLGHKPQAGEKVTLALVEDDERDPQYEQDFENWLRTEVLASVRELRDNPASGMTVDEVRAGLAARHARRLAAQ